MKNLKQSTSQKHNVERWVPGAGREGHREVLVRRCKVSFYKMSKSYRYAVLYSSIVNAYS